jgi:hypothetical protein
MGLQITFIFYLSFSITNSIEHWVFQIGSDPHLVNLFSFYELKINYTTVYQRTSEKLSTKQIKLLLSHLFNVNFGIILPSMPRPYL